MSVGKKQGYQKAWQVQVPGIKMFDSTTDRRGVAAYSDSGVLYLFDHNGKELWHRETGLKLVDISLSDTLEILAIDNEKYMHLFGLDGTTQWRKRPFPTVAGKISASGQYMSFITPDPAIISTDRALRTRWVYRNLLKRPLTLCISDQGQTTAFPCADDRGEGIGAVSQTGNPYDAFMGIDPVISIDVAEDGQNVLALDKNGGIFCINFVKSFGVWKGQINSDFNGVSYASLSGESLVYSRDGLVTKLDEKGVPAWEHRFSDRILKAVLSSDSQAIYYATERGEVGCLKANTGQIVNRLEFLEIDVPAPLPENKSEFVKLWNVELPSRSPLAKPSVHPWKGSEGVEYFLVWDGKDRLVCLNDVGEEVWENRQTGIDVFAVSVSPETDTAVLATSKGIIGFDLSGYEKFKFFGNFSDLHLFQNEALVLLDNRSQVKYYQNPKHFSHVLKTPEKILEIIGNSDSAYLIGEQNLYKVANTGELVATWSLPAKINSAKLIENGRLILIGTSGGHALILNEDFEEIFNYELKEPVILVEYNAQEETVFAVTMNSDEVLTLQCRTGEMTRTKLTGRLKYSASSEFGAILGTEMDQLGLIGNKGELLARYTFPDKIVRLRSCCENGRFLVLSEESVSFYTTSNSSVEHGTMSFLEI